MKIIAIGDIHGRDIWKEIIKKEQKTDKVIFIGDYFDSREISSSTQINNFKEIINFKITNTDLVELIIGNHDYQYLPYINER